MIKGKTSLTVFIEFVMRERHLPNRQEFMDCGYSSRSFYNARNQYYEFIKNENNLEGLICAAHNCDGDCKTCYGGTSCRRDTLRDLGVNVNE